MNSNHPLFSNVFCLIFVLSILKIKNFNVSFFKIYNFFEKKLFEHFFIFKDFMLKVLTVFEKKNMIIFSVN